MPATRREAPGARRQKAEQHGIARNEDLVVEVVVVLGEDAERRRRGRRAIRGFGEKQPRERLVTVQGRKGLVGATQQPQQIRCGQGPQVWQRPEVAVDLRDQIVGQRGKRDLEPPDSP